MPVRRLAPLAVLALPLVLASACGGGGDATNTSQAKPASHEPTPTTDATAPTSTTATTATTAPSSGATTTPAPAAATTTAPPTTVRPSGTPAPAPTTTTAAPRPTTTQAPVASGPASVTISNYVYAPDTVRVRAGSSVTWTNNDSAPHTATDEGHAWDAGSIANGQSATVTFTTPGTYTYTCTLHPTMKGRIVVVG